MKIAGLDIGTTGCKLTVFDENGERLGKAYREYAVRRDMSGHEIDVNAMMEGVYAVIRETAQRYKDLAGIGVTSFGESFVMTDRTGQPLHPAMLYTDPRGAEECAELMQRTGEEHITQITGVKPNEMYSVSKVMWIKRHQPEIYAAAEHIFLMEDYAVWRLTGRAQIDYSLAARTMAFDINTLAWSRKIIEAAGIDPRLMSEPVPTGSDAGCILPEIAEATGLPPNCRIISVSHDQVAAAVGAGAFDGRTAVDGAGTSECLTPVYDSLPDLTVMSRGAFCAVPYALPGKYVTYAFASTGGALIRWGLETFGKGETYESMEAGYTRDEPTGLLVLPHFAGSGTPSLDMGSKGAILGLTTATDGPMIYRACMEGVAYEMRLNYEALAETGVHPEKLHATGGGAKSRAWMQIKADVLNLPITALRTSDAGTVGSAMLTGIVTGLYTGPEDAARHMVREAETYEPRPEMHRKYMRIYERYRKLYEAVRPLV